MVSDKQCFQVDLCGLCLFVRDECVLNATVTLRKGFP